MHLRCGLLAGLLAALTASTPAHAQFKPFGKTSGETTESHTGLWFGTFMTSNTPKLPIETLTRATKESVDGGSALRVIEFST